MIGSLQLLIIAGLSGVVPCEGVIHGRVVDGKDGRPLARARLDAGENSKPVRTDAKGQYRLTGVCAGPAKLRVVRSDYALRIIKINVEKNQELNVTLAPITVTQGDDILVQAPRLKASDTRSVVSLEGDVLMRTRGENLAAI